MTCMSNYNHIKLWYVIKYPRLNFAVYFSRQIDQSIPWNKRIKGLQNHWTISEILHLISHRSFKYIDGTTGLISCRNKFFHQLSIGIMFRKLHLYWMLRGTRIWISYWVMEDVLFFIPLPNWICTRYYHVFAHFERIWACNINSQCLFAMLITFSLT